MSEYEKRREKVIIRFEDKVFGAYYDVVDKIIDSGGPRKFREIMSSLLEKCGVLCGVMLARKSGSVKSCFKMHKVGEDHWVQWLIDLRLAGCSIEHVAKFRRLMG